MHAGQEPSQAWNGDPIDEAEALRRLRNGADPSGQYYAAWWLGRNRTQNPDAVQLLKEALRQRRARQLGDEVEENAVARNAARALGKLGAIADSAIPDLLETLNDADHGLREAAARSLGQLRAQSAIPLLIERLSSGPEVAGAKEDGSPRMKEPCGALLEALGDIGINTPRVVEVLKLFLTHERPVVRSSACRALLQLTHEEQWGEAMVALLQHDQLQVRRAALMDLGATGWRPALPAISNTLAENSLKLIALRGLAETADNTAVDEAILDAMDALL